MELTVIIPAFNEESRISRTLERVLSYLNDQRIQFELLVVDDGSTDRTVEIAQGVIAPQSCCRIVSLAQNSGKGAAVRRGIFESMGDLILFSDADLSTPIEEYSKLRTAIDSGFDISIGSRALPDSQILLHQPWYRERIGKTFNLLVRMILGLSIPDTQCGFKCFKRQAAKMLAGLQRVEGWAFDAELLFLAQKQGFKIAEIPVTWINDRGTKLGIFSSSAQMLWEILKVRFRSLVGGYRVKALKEASQSALGPG